MSAILRDHQPTLLLHLYTHTWARNKNSNSQQEVEPQDDEDGENYRQLPKQAVVKPTAFQHPRRSRQHDEGE